MLTTPDHLQPTSYPCTVLYSTVLYQRCHIVIVIVARVSVTGDWEQLMLRGTIDTRATRKTYENIR
jgi:hypothetical protein